MEEVAFYTGKPTQGGRAPAIGSTHGLDAYENGDVWPMLKEFYTGLLLFFYIYYFHVGVCGTVSHGSCVEVRGQTMGVIFLFPPCGSKADIRLRGG